MGSHLHRFLRAECIPPVPRNITQEALTQLSGYASILKKGAGAHLQPDTAAGGAAQSPHGPVRRMLRPTGMVWLRDVGGVVGCLQQGHFKQGWEGNRGFCAQALKGFDCFFHLLFARRAPTAYSRNFSSLKMLFYTQHSCHQGLLNTAKCLCRTETAWECFSQWVRLKVQ